MEYPTNHRDKIERSNLKYTFDGHFLPTTPPDDDGTTNTAESNHSNFHPNPTTGLAASIQVIANTMLRMELAQLNMLKKREIAHLEAQKRQAEFEDDMTRIMLQTQLQIASFICQNRANRKRKSSRINDDSESSSKKR